MTNYDNQDISTFINKKFKESKQLENQISTKNSPHKDLLENLTEFLTRQSRGCYLYVKMVLDLIEQGHLVVKSNGFKVKKLNITS